MGVKRIAVLGALGLSACASQPPCPAIRDAYPHTTLEQQVLADQLPTLPHPAQDWLTEYTLLRASGVRVCQAGAP